jgi:hypothetical protein
VSAQGLGPARQDVGDGAAVRRRHRRAMGRLVAGSEAAEDVRDLDHGRSSEPGHEPVEEPAQRGPGRLRQVGVEGGGGDAFVAEQNLDHPGIDAILQQSGSVAVPQGARGRSAVLGQAGRRR